MRLGYLSAARIPSRAANAVQSINMCAAFAGLGHDVHAWCRAGDVGDVFELYGVAPFDFRPLQQRGPRGLHTALFLHDLVRQVAELRPDIVFSRDVLSLAALAHLRRPMILEVHRTLTHRAERAAFAWVQRQPSFRRLITVSHGMRAAFLADFPGLDGSKVIVLPGAARAVASSDKPLDNPWNGRADALQVGYVGHLYEGRGIDVVVAMAKALDAVDFHVVGGERADIDRWRARAPLANLHFHGFWSHSQLQPRLHAFDVLVAPYQKQVFVQGGAETSAVMSPLKLFEYMSTARAIVCSDLPVLREVMHAEQNALLVTPDDPAAWVAAIERLADPHLRRRLGTAARSQFLAHHTWTARAQAALDGVLVTPRPA